MQIGFSLSVALIILGSSISAVLLFLGVYFLRKSEKESCNRRTTFDKEFGQRIAILINILENIESIGIRDEIIDKIEKLVPLAPNEGPQEKNWEECCKEMIEIITKIPNFSGFKKELKELEKLRYEETRHTNTWRWQFLIASSIILLILETYLSFHLFR